ncbi:MAG: hypothetical protein J3K34DRAFT_412666 [Monoraphidium minutum]|nr:MAG: hypothetical protein J3K34DRAFT_412666 [Monoraphidium minutum]
MSTWTRPAAVWMRPAARVDPCCGIDALCRGIAEGRGAPARARLLRAPRLRLRLGSHSTRRTRCAARRIGRGSRAPASVVGVLRSRCATARWVPCGDEQPTAPTHKNPGRAREPTRWAFSCHDCREHKARIRRRVMKMLLSDAARHPGPCRQRVLVVSSLSCGKTWIWDRSAGVGLLQRSACVRGVCARAAARRERLRSPAVTLQGCASR